MSSPPRSQTPVLTAATLLRGLGLRLQLHWQAAKIVLVYAAVAGSWIAFSDKLLGAVVRDPETLVRISLIKGFAFVTATAGLLFLLLHRTFRRIESALTQVARKEGERQVAEARLQDKTHQLERANQQLQLDITARAAAEAALRESEERFRQLAETIDDVFSLSSLSGEPLYVSSAYERVFGRSLESLYQNPQSWIESVHEEDRARVSRWLSHRAEDQPDETYRIQRPDGSLRWLRARTYPVRDGAGRVHRVAGVCRDITELRLLEEQLRQAQKMEAIGRLAGGVAHDFNNILSVVLSYTSLALDQLAESDPLRADIEEVRRAGERATELTGQLLAFGRRQPRQPRVVALQEVLRQMEKMLRRLLGEDVTLSLTVLDARHRVYADPGQIEQIVMNLAINARDAMPRGGALSIEIADVELPEAAHTDLAPGSYVRLTVTDTGTGMDLATRERVFEPFFTTKEVGKGTGLGLSTVFGIVKQSHGHIEVDSQPGAGATFRIYFPACDRAPDLLALGAAPPRSLQGTETILLVEDDAQVRAVNRTILQRNGYDVIEVADGEEAKLASERTERPIQLLLTDVVMPRLGGHALAAQLARSRPEMRVLYVSGYAEDAIVHHGLVEPGLCLLQKPVTPDALLRKVRQVLDTPSHPAG